MTTDRAGAGLYCAASLEQAAASHAKSQSPFDKLGKWNDFFEQVIYHSGDQMHVVGLDGCYPFEKI